MKRLIMILACTSLAAMQLSAQTPNYPFRDTSLPMEQRIDDLIGRLTSEEKIAMMQNGSKGVERLGIPDYNWWNEALHGVARAGVATVFPQAIGLAATFDPEFHEQIFSVISDEARAKYNESIRNGEHRQYYGLSFWTPNINIFRDPRWGRGQETYGEDPYLTSVIGMAAVRGLQGNDDKYYKTHACAKHFAVHSGPEPNRHEFDATASGRDLWETYLPAFKALVTQADVREVMTAYNRFEGVPCAASDRLVNDILRGKWAYSGMIVSDCGAISDFYRETNSHHTHPDAKSASSAAVINGTDVECGNSYRSLSEALTAGLITEEQIDESLRRTLRGWIELGLLDPDDANPWHDIPFSIVASEEHAKASLEAARKSIVMLKNDGVLPVLPSSVNKIAVLGPNAADSSMMLGNYNGTPTHVVTILDGIKAAFPAAKVSYERGCDLVEGWVQQPRILQMMRRPAGPGAPGQGQARQGGQRNEQWQGIPNMDPETEARMKAEFEQALKEAKQPINSDNYTPDALAALASRAAESDVIFFVGGISPAVEGEEIRGMNIDGFSGGDRTKIELPEIQARVLKALHATGKPVVLILCTGSAIALENVEGDYDALLTAWYPGQEGGTAVADVITGKFNPSGRLPITFYKSTGQLPDFSDYSMDGRTYRYMHEEPLYAFGYGLSYSSFAYSKPKLSSKTIKAGEDVSVNVEVRNTGKVAGDEIVQVYVKRLGDNEAPVKSLKAVRRVSLEPGQKASVTLNLPASSFEYYLEGADGTVVKSGEYQILVGGSSFDRDLTGASLKIK